jgi:hypothetical protein
VGESLELRELKKISKVLLLANSVAVEKEIAKIANSETRKKMWVLLDGKRLQKDIANQVGVTNAAVSYFVSAGVAANLIERTDGETPSRLIDYVPPAWIELTLKPPTQGHESTKTIQENKKVKEGI